MSGENWGGKEVATAGSGINALPQFLRSSIKLNWILGIDEPARLRDRYLRMEMHIKLRLPFTLLTILFKAFKRFIVNVVSVH